MPAVSRGDGMRGLAVFIADIRNCKYIDIILMKFNWLDIKVSSFLFSSF